MQYQNKKYKLLFFLPFLFIISCIKNGDTKESCISLANEYEELVHHKTLLTTTTLGGYSGTQVAKKLLFLNKITAFENKLKLYEKNLIKNMEYNIKYKYVYKKCFKLSQIIEHYQMEKEEAYNIYRKKIQSCSSTKKCSKNDTNSLTKRWEENRNNYDKKFKEEIEYQFDNNWFKAYVKQLELEKDNVQYHPPHSSIGDACKAEMLFLAEAMSDVKYDLPYKVKRNLNPITQVLKNNYYQCLRNISQPETSNTDF